MSVPGAGSVGGGAADARREGRAPVGPPGPRLPAPLQTARLWRDPDGFLADCAGRFGDVFGLRLWPIGEVAVVSAPQAIVQLLRGPADELLTGEATRRLLPILDERSLPCLDGPEHRARRRLLLPVFGGRRLATYAERIEAAVAAELAGWPPGRTVAALPRLRRLSLAIAAELVLGENPAELGPLLREAVSGRAALGALFPGLAPARRGLERRRRRLERLFAECARRPVSGEHALAAMLEAGLDEEAILAELGTLLVVAHESTACALAWALELLARHPQQLERLRDGDERYTEAVAHEILRLRPPVLDAVRLAAAPLRLADGSRIEVGTIVMAAPLLVHRRPELYPDPDRFRPERFLDGKPPPGAFVPFGGGERRCLGAQLALLELTSLLRVVARRFALASAGSAAERMRLIGTAVAPARGARVVVQPVGSGYRRPASSSAANSTVTGGRSSVCCGRA